MSQRRRQVADYLAYLGVRLVEMFVHMSPPHRLYDLAARAGDLWYRLDRRHRERAAAHLRPGFPDWDERRVQQTVRGSFRNLIYLAIEVLLTTRLITHYRWRRHIVLTTSLQEGFRLAVERSGGIVFITGHFGGWEVVGYMMAALGFRGYALARPLDNPYINAHLMGLRQRMGLRILDKFGAAYRLESLLKQHEYICFIADQDAGRRGHFVEYFNRTASSYRTPAVVAMRTNSPIVVGYGRRLGERFCFEVGIERVIHPEEWTGREDAAQWITQQWTAALEQSVRRAPEQYLWIYRRWKTQPDAAK